MAFNKQLTDFLMYYFNSKSPLNIQQIFIKIFIPKKFQNTLIPFILFALSGVRVIRNIKADESE